MHTRYDGEAMKKIIFPVLIAILLIGPASTFGAPVEHRESAGEPNILRLAPIKWDGYTPSTVLKPQSRAAVSSTAITTDSTAASSPTLGPNLVPNPSLETADSTGLPQSWKKGGYGTNTRTVTYPVVGSGGSTSKAIRAAISGYTSGDAKWYPNEIPVTAGKTYQFSDVYQSTVPSIVELRFTLSNGSFVYKDIATPGTSASFSPVSAQVVAPPNSTSVTIFHLIKANGTLTTDDYELREVTPPLPDSNNSLQNGNFETANANGTAPLHWGPGGYGSNTRTFTYPSAGENGNGAKITVSNYVGGDAKWVSDRVSLPSGSYIYADSYIATASTILTAEFARADGSLFYSDLKTLPASSSWAHTSATFTLPIDAVSVRIFHLIKSNGTLTIDNASIVSAGASGGGIFSTGAVSFRFDDGLINHYTNVAPVLDAVGFKGVFYIITHQIAENGYPGYMSVAQIKNVASRGHEIGAHTRTHAHLTSLSATEQQNEIVGSRQDLLGWNVGPILSFSYPFGEYDATTLGIVKNGGFSSAVSTISGYVTQNSDHYQLEYQELKNNTTLAQVKQWVDTAASTHTWLILTFHDVQDSPTEYGITPAMFQSIVNYVKQKNIPVVTVMQGLNSM